MENDDEMSPLSFGDPLLACLYKAIAHDNHGEFGVTLLTGGAWLSGMAISGRSWFEHVAKLASGQGSDADQTFKMIGQQLYPGEVEVEAGVVEPPPADRRIGFIHLRDARLFHGDASLPTDGGLVRIRLDAIDGWVFGTLGPAGYKSPPPSV
jgi:hypothetical protein